MRVDQLPRKDTQPFYNVLVMDGSNRYNYIELKENIKNAAKALTHVLILIGLVYSSANLTRN